MPVNLLRDALGRFLTQHRTNQGKNTGDFGRFSDYGTTRPTRNLAGAARKLSKGERDLSDDELFDDEK